MVSVMVILAASSGAQAGEFCSNINTLMDQSQRHFADITGKADGDAGDHDANLALAGASYCRVTKPPKTSSYYCAWEFPYRATHAYNTFDAFIRDLDDCIGQHAASHDDQDVNHPDYYALRRYETAQSDVSVSIKDKSALDRTFVFIRVQGAQTD